MLDYKLLFMISKLLAKKKQLVNNIIASCLRSHFCCPVLELEDLGVRLAVCGSFIGHQASACDLKLIHSTKVTERSHRWLSLGV